MHNTPLRNAEFQVTFTETNLRFLLTDNPQDPIRIERCKAQLEEANQLVETIKRELNPEL